MVTIRLLQSTDAEQFAEFRRSSLIESPLAFAGSPSDDQASSIESVRERLTRAPDAVVFGAFDSDLVGTVGLYRNTRVKFSHKAHLWGMYVAPSHRRQGLGSQLLNAAIQHARTLPGVAWLHLTVSSAASDAKHLYKLAGFVEWGTEPDAIRHGGHSVGEHHMALRLDDMLPTGLSNSLLRSDDHG